MITFNSPPSEESLSTLAVLKSAVTHALEKKRKLGQYAVIWKDGAVDLNHFDVLSNAELNHATGILKAPQGITLEQMDAAIKARNSDKNKL